MSDFWAIQIPRAILEDMVLFFVRPTEKTSAKANASVALVLSTFTYLAYANEHIYARESTWLRTKDGIHNDDNFKKDAA